MLVAVLSGRAAKYAARRDIIRTAWGTDLVAFAAKQNLIVRVIFVVADNFCRYNPAVIPVSAHRFPSQHCKVAVEHMVGGQLSDEHTQLLTEYRRYRDLIFVPETLDSYYSSARKVQRFYKMLSAAQINFGIVLKVDDDAVIMRKMFLEHYINLKSALLVAAPRWWGHFSEQWEPVRPVDADAEIEDRHTRTHHVWTVTVDQWPYIQFPLFAVGTGHALNKAAVKCFADNYDRINANTSIWMEDVAHGVWFDVCAAFYKNSSRINAARIFDFRWAKSPDTQECRADSHLVGSVDSRAAQFTFSKVGRKGDCSCGQGNDACHDDDTSKFSSKLLSSHGGKWPWISAGTSYSILSNAHVLNISNISQQLLWNP